jgi:hypothetical protein
MKLLNSLKIPVMVAMTVGGVWLSAWGARFSDPHRREILPATTVAQQISNQVRSVNPADQAAAFPDEYLR